MPATPSSLAQSKALRLLAGKSYSEEKLREKLQASEFEEEVVEDTLLYLKSRGYLDDEKLCGSLFRKFAQSGRYGRRQIAAKLRAQGFSAALVNQYMKEYDQDEEAAQALNLARRRYRQKFDGEALTKTELDKIAGYLTGRGFSYQAVMKAADALLADLKYGGVELP